MAVSLLAPGFLFLLAATALLIVVSVSTPVWRDVYFLKIHPSTAVASAIPAGLGNDFRNSGLKLGAWGYCFQNICSRKHLGYTVPKAIVGGQAGNVISKATRALILHPIAAGMSLLALLFALCGNIVSGIIASLGAFLAFLVALIALAVDLGIFVTAKHRVDKIDGTSAHYGNALWMTLAATILLLLASLTVCCAHHRQRRARGYDDGSVAKPATREARQPFWKRRNEPVV